MDSMVASTVAWQLSRHRKRRLLDYALTYGIPFDTTYSMEARRPEIRRQRSVSSRCWPSGCGRATSYLTTRAPRVAAAHQGLVQLSQAGRVELYPTVAERNSCLREVPLLWRFRSLLPQRPCPTRRRLKFERVLETPFRERRQLGSKKLPAESNKNRPSGLFSRACADSSTSRSEWTPNLIDRPRRAKIGLCVCVDERALAPRAGCFRAIAPRTCLGFGGRPPLGMPCTGVC